MMFSEVDNMYSNNILLHTFIYKITILEKLWNGIQIFNILCHCVIYLKIDFIQGNVSKPIEYDYLNQYI